MEKVYSNINKNKLLHFVVRKVEATQSRTNLIDDHHYLQCSTINLGAGATFKPHKHVWKPMSELVIAQESWVVIQGSVKCIYYDLDDKILEEKIIYSGDASFTLEGGHNYEILEDDTLVYEYKTGPYKGIVADKVFI